MPTLDFCAFSKASIIYVHGGEMRDVEISVSDLKYYKANERHNLWAS